ncbi:hypothetical protein [Nocardioides ungokensis]
MTLAVGRTGGPTRHAAASRRPGSAVVVCGVLVVVAATAFRIWALQGAWFFFDDFYFMQLALDHGLTPAYLVTPYNGHLMPASTLLCWINARIDPLDFTIPATEMVVLFAGLGLAFLRLLLRLFGRRPAVLVPLVAFLFSPVLLPATIWWAAGVNQLPMLLATVLALDAFVDHLREPRTGSLVRSLAWIALGLAFVERSVLAFLLLWLVALLYFCSGTFPERCAELWRRYRSAVVAHGAFLAAYLAVYVPWALNFDARTVTHRPLFAVVRDMVGTAFGSAAVGGPLHWGVSDVTQNEAQPSQLVLLLGWGVLAVLVLASAVTRRRGLRAWLLPASLLAANAGLIATSRAIYFGPQIALDYRFQTEAALALALAVGLAFLPVAGARECAEPVPATWAVDTRSVAVGSCVVFVVLATVSTDRFPLRNLTTTSPRAYYAHVEQSAREHPGTQLLDQPTPRWVWAPLAYPTNTYSHMFRPIGHGLTARTITTDDASVVDDRGVFRAIRFHPVRHQVSRLPRSCFGHTWPGTSRWRLDGPVIGIGWFLRLEYVAPATTDIEITISGERSHTRLFRGHHVLLMPAIGSYDSVVLDTPAGAEPVCLRAMSVGTISPAS